MKVNYPLRKTSFLLLSLASLWACSDKGEKTPDIPEEGFPVTPNLVVEPGAVNKSASLKYSLLIFRASSNSGDYALVDELSPVVEQSRLRMTLKELDNNDYLFLFTAQSSSDEEFQVIDDATTTAPQNGALWDDIRIIQSGDLTLDCYYVVKKMTGREIIDQGTIAGELDRMVGQMTFDFYKTSGGIDDATAIDGAAANSVLDRIKSIDITYSGMANELQFSLSGDRYILAPSGYEDPATTLTQTIEVDLDDYKLAASQTDENILTDHNGVGGKARLLGLVFFPADETLRAEMNLTYFDTTPICGDITAEHTHTDDCFMIKTLPLYLPAEDDPESLSIFSDTYTVNKAAITMDRVIDVPRTGGITIDTSWPNVEP